MSIKKSFKKTQIYRYKPPVKVHLVEYLIIFGNSQLWIYYNGEIDYVEGPALVGSGKSRWEKQ